MKLKMIGLFFLFLFIFCTSCKSKELHLLDEIFPIKGYTTVNLTVKVTEISIPLTDYGKGAYFKYTGRLYEYNGIASLPGPIIHVQPGGKLILNIFNEMGKQNYEAEGLTNMYIFHGVNTTNVHFHGIHGDPSIDNVFKTADPGNSLTYNLPIPKEHLPGFHWYHTHAHGSTYPLLMGGLFGPIIVDDIKEEIKNKKSFKSLSSCILMIHLYRLRKSNICDGATMDAVDESIKNNVSSKPRIINKNGKEIDLPNDLFLVNGQHKPSVKVIKGQPTLLRLAFASGSCHLNITLPKECNYHLTAIDGVPMQKTREIKNKWLYFTTATRYDIITLCKEDQNKKLPIIFKEINETIFYINVVEEGKENKFINKFTFPLNSNVNNIHYLIANKPTIKRDISFSQLGIPTSPRPYYVIGQGNDCSSLLNSSSCYYEHFMGQKGNLINNYQGFAVPLNSVIEAHVYGDPTDDKPHPLHLHVNHFIFIKFTPRKGGKHENISISEFGIFPGDIRDTMPILDGVTIIRWRAASYIGEVVYHCHALAHEDQGMMNSYLVYDNNNNNNNNSSNNAGFGEEGNIIASENTEIVKNEYLFLILAFIFLFGAILSAVFGWLRGNSNNLGDWAAQVQNIHETRMSHRTFEGDEMERLPLTRKN